MDFLIFGLVTEEPVTKWYTIDGWTTAGGEAPPSVVWKPIIFMY